MRTTSREKRKLDDSENVEVQSSSSISTTPSRNSQEEILVVDEAVVVVAAVVVATETSLAEIGKIEEAIAVVVVATETEEETEETFAVVVEAVVETSEASSVVAAVIVAVADLKAMVLLWQSTTRVPSLASAESRRLPKTHPPVLQRAQIDIHNYFYFDKERHSVAGQITKWLFATPSAESRSILK